MTTGGWAAPPAGTPRSAPYGYLQLAADAVAVLDGWEAEQAHFVGMSMGAVLCQLVALDHPQRMLSMSMMLSGALDVDFPGNIRRAFAGEPSVDGLPLPQERFLKALAVMNEDVDGREAELDRRVRRWKLFSGDEIPFDEADFRRWERQAIDHSGSSVSRRRTTPCSRRRASAPPSCETSRSPLR